MEEFGILAAQVNTGTGSGATPSRSAAKKPRTDSSLGFRPAGTITSTSSTSVVVESLQWWLAVVAAPRAKPYSTSLGSRNAGIYGGAEGDRTLDLRIANATLSQLSYRPTARRAILAPRSGTSIYNPKAAPDPDRPPLSGAVRRSPRMRL
jgi:hypothetical protein